MSGDDDVSTCAPSDVSDAWTDSTDAESVHTLVEDPDLVQHCRSQIPEEGYYQNMLKAWEEQSPEVDPMVLRHVLELEKLCDVAMIFGCSFKATKAWLLQKLLKLLGTMCGRDGLLPDPAKVESVVKWPEILTPKNLKEFLGTIGWIRPFCSPTFSFRFEALRPYLRDDADWEQGLDDAARKSVEHLKDIAANYIKLSLVDAEAVTDPKESGRGLEQVADAMGKAWGSLLVQLDKEFNSSCPP
jgi:hypothetical protein